MYQHTDLSVYATMIEQGDVVNLLGWSVDIPRILTEFSANTKQFASYLAAGAIPEDFTLWIPDLWHVTYGDAPCFPKGDAKIIWDAVPDAIKAAQTAFDYVEYHVFRHGLKGQLWRGVRPALKSNNFIEMLH